MRLTYLCDIELSHEQAPALVRPYGTEEGNIYGQGGGTVSGEHFRGSMRWVNIAHRRSDGSMLPDMCGIITTEDGAIIRASMSGRTVWVDTTHGRVGSQLLRVLFETEDQRLHWLNDAVCVMEGKVDPQIGTGPSRGHMGAARVYICINELL